MLRELDHVDFVCGKRLNRQDDFIRRTSSIIARSSCDRMSWRRQGTENRLELFLDLPFVPATPGGR